GGGADHIYGDAGFNVDPFTRSLFVENWNTSTHRLSDDLALGADDIDGGDGDDIIIGDYGNVVQAAPGDVANPLYDYLATPANDPRLKLFTTAANTVWRIETTRIEAAGARNGADTLRGGGGDDVIFGGIGSETAGDLIDGGAGND